MMQSVCRVPELNENSVLAAEDVAWLHDRAVPVVVTVRGDSMRPTLPPGARVRLIPLSPPASAHSECADAPAVGRGDVVAIRSPAGVVLHRIVFVSKEWLGHQGDASWRSAIARRQNVIGRAVDFARAVDAPAKTHVPGAVPPAPLAARWRQRWGRAICRLRVLRRQLWFHGFLRGEDLAE